MNIYLHEFKMSLRSVITWSIALIVMIFFFTSIYSGFAEEAEILNQTLEKFPREFLMAFGMDGMDMSTVLGFFALIFLFCQLCVSIQAANYGFSLVSVEEREMTADFLLPKPVGRTKIMSSKLLSAITGLAITNLVVWISSFVFINIYRDGRPYEVETLALLLLTVTFFQLFFLTVSLLISMLPKKIRSVTPFSMAMVFGLYILNAFGGMIGDDKLSYITPFRHFNPNYIIRNGSYEMPLALISVSLIVVSLVGSYLLYTRRDIHTAV
ncbi:MAG: ABC transporter permease subunit [Anaerolineales bacterium]|nr:ABC transporter permease subunit [Anaerolineales bacterium]